MPFRRRLRSHGCLDGFAVFAHNAWHWVCHTVGIPTGSLRFPPVTKDMRMSDASLAPLAPSASFGSEALPAGPQTRRRSVGVWVGSGKGAVKVGGGAPIVVQSVTNTDTAGVEQTVKQGAELARARSEL